MPAGSFVRERVLHEMYVTTARAWLVLKYSHMHIDDIRSSANCETKCNALHFALCYRHVCVYMCVCVCVCVCVCMPRL